MARRDLTVRTERWPIAGGFRIARGAKTEAEVVVVAISEDGALGRGESTPYARYGETTAGVLVEIDGARAALEAGASREALQGLLPAGAARNALDCALWDLEAKRSGTPAWRAAGLSGLEPVMTLYTLSLDTPEAMGRAAANSRRSLLKLKIDGTRDVERVAAVRAAVPGARLVVDANEALSLSGLKALAPALKDLGVELIEQPLPAAEDAVLEGYDCPVTLCADESLHSMAELDACARRYGCINVKLDKAGGLTEALALAAAARSRGLAVMAGCMVATSLSIAPAMLLAQGAEFVDLDGALLLVRDRKPGLAVHGSRLQPPGPDLWG
ncbi:N-acetyl-D-Glu racemase DgcA [Phenylobacterium sp.]|uniref:N-acetyl-D-Glu racemase DgcA n=1 Tax=Phenylobacterium sp. TaxID=1871053 RepID=UPI002F3EFEF9